MKPNKIKEERKRFAERFNKRNITFALDASQIYILEDMFFDLLEEMLREQRKEFKNLLKEHIAHLKKTGWITTDKDLIDAINQFIE